MTWRHGNQLNLERSCLTPCLYRKPNAGGVLMKLAKDGAPNDSGPLNGAIEWRILFQGPVRSDAQL
jgi:hypothetical protein